MSSTTTAITFPETVVKCRKGSIAEGQLEDWLWRPIGNGSKRSARRRIGAILQAARRLEFKTRVQRKKDSPGARIGALGPIALEVLAKLYDLVHYATGRLEPSIAFLATELGYSYAGIHAALKRLKAHGFLDWWRRSRSLDREGEAGPQIEQISNAYVLTVPQALEAYIQRLVGPAPVPEDAQWSRDDQRQELDAMLRSLATAAEYHEATFDGDDALGARLRSLAASLDARDARERESTKSSQPGVI